MMVLWEKFSSGEAHVNLALEWGSHENSSRIITVHEIAITQEQWTLHEEEKYYNLVLISGDSS